MFRLSRFFALAAGSPALSPLDWTVQETGFRREFVRGVMQGMKFSGKEVTPASLKKETISQATKCLKGSSHCQGGAASPAPVAAR